MTFLHQKGELLALECEQTRLWVYNCTWFADVLDEAASEVVKFDDGRIFRIKKHAWRSEIEHETIFRLPQIRASDTYITEPVAERIRSEGLQGFALRECPGVPS